MASGDLLPADRNGTGLPDKGRVRGTKASGSFAQNPNGGNLNVSVKADTLNIHASNLAALERLAEHSPAIAEKIIDATNMTVKYDSRKYTVGAVSAAAVCSMMILGAVAIIILKGFLEGIVFFSVCAAASTIFASIFTGSTEGLSWTVGILRKEKNDNATQDD